MDLYQLTPTSLPEAKRRYSGRCAACGQGIKYSQSIVHLYGEAFHHDCAFYRQGRDNARLA